MAASVSMTHVGHGVHEGAGRIELDGLSKDIMYTEEVDCHKPPIFVSFARQGCAGRVKQARALLAAQKCGGPRPERNRSKVIYSNS